MLISVMMREIRKLVVEKKFPNEIDSLPDKLLWAYNELGEAVQSHVDKEDPIEIQTELIDVIFYLLDFLGIMVREHNIQTTDQRYDKELSQFIIDTNTEYDNIHMLFTEILSRIARISNSYKKGKPWRQIEDEVLIAVEITSNCCFWYGQMKQNSFEFFKTPDDIFEEKLEKNFKREVQFGQKRSINNNH